MTGHAFPLTWVEKLQGSRPQYMGEYYDRIQLEQRRIFFLIYDLALINVPSDIVQDRASFIS